MTSLILCLLLSGAVAPLGNKHKISDVIMRNRSSHVVSRSSSLINENGASRWVDCKMSAMILMINRTIETTARHTMTSSIRLCVHTAVSTGALPTAGDLLEVNLNVKVSSKYPVIKTPFIIINAFRACKLYAGWVA